MSTLSNFLGTLGFKTSAADEYQKNTLTVIEEAIKVEKLLKAYIDQQRVFTDSLVEWTAGKEPTSKLLTDLARILSQINFEWTKSQEVFRESISRVRHEFEVIATDLGDREYFESRFEGAKKELEVHRRKLEKGNKFSESDRIKVIEKERRKRRDFEEYLANRENQTMVKVKRSFNGLAHGFMHQGASSFNIYRAFQTALSNILPDDEYQIGDIILKPEDYLAITEGRAESSLAIEREISRSRASSLARSVERRRNQRATKSAPALTLTDREQPSIGTDSFNDQKEWIRTELDASNVETDNSKVEAKDGEKKKKKRGRKNRKTQAYPQTEDSGPQTSAIESEKLNALTVEKSPTNESINKSSHMQDSPEKPATPTSVSGTIKSSSLENQSAPVSEGYEVSSPSHSEKSLRSPMQVHEPINLLTGNPSPSTTEDLVKTSPVEHV